MAGVSTVVGLNQLLVYPQSKLQTLQELTLTSHQQKSSLTLQTLTLKQIQQYQEM